MLDNVEFTLSLIRHGQSTTNVNPDLMGQLATTPLTAHGQWQAERLGNRLFQSGQTFTHVFSSPYTRALDTAKIVLKCAKYSQPIGLVDDLREYDAGDWTGVSRKEALTLPVQNRMGHLNHFFLPPNGESLNQVQRRASKWLEECILYGEHFGISNNNILCFSHGMTIKCLLSHIIGSDKSFTWKIHIDNTSITKLYFGAKGWELLSVNDCSHLF